MSRQHFIKHCMEEVPVVEASSEEDMYFDLDRQYMIGKEGDLCFEAGWYSNAHTSSKYIKGHRTRSNKWVSGRTRPSKTDRRKGK